MIVRACVVDNGDINSETEIGRIDHCGLMDYLEFDNKRYRGCVLSCNTDGCNSAVRLNTVMASFAALLFSSFYVFLL
jgi:hypothetical protein